jgi:hypothetical protein
MWQCCRAQREKNNSFRHPLEVGTTLGVGDFYMYYIILKCEDRNDKNNEDRKPC